MSVPPETIGIKENVRARFIYVHLDGEIEFGRHEAHSSCKCDGGAFRSIPRLDLKGNDNLAGKYQELLFNTGKLQSADRNFMFCPRLVRRDC